MARAQKPDSDTGATEGLIWGQFFIEWLKGSGASLLVIAAWAVIVWCGVSAFFRAPTLESPTPQIANPAPMPEQGRALV